MIAGSVIAGSVIAGSCNRPATGSGIGMQPARSKVGT